MGVYWDYVRILVHQKIGVAYSTKSTKALFRQVSTPHWVDSHLEAASRTRLGFYRDP